MSNLQYLSEYQSFENKAELNEAVSRHTERNKYEMNTTDYDVLTYIARHAVKYAGAAHLKIATIVQAIGKSKRTIQRSITKLARLGIFERRSFIRRVKGGFGASLFIFLPFDDTSEMTHRTSNEKPCDSKAEDVEITNEPYTSLSYKDLSSLKTYASASSDITTFENESDNSPYGRFKSSIQSFVTDNKLVYRMYGVYKAQSKRLKQAYNKDTLINVAIKAIRTTFIASKGRKIRNLAGYYNGVLSNMYDDLYYAFMDEIIGDCSTFELYG